MLTELSSSRESSACDLAHQGPDSLLLEPPSDWSEQHVRETCRTILDQRKISQEEAAPEIGLSRQQISLFLRGLPDKDTPKVIDVVSKWAKKEIYLLPARGKLRRLMAAHLMLASDVATAVRGDRPESTSNLRNEYINKFASGRYIRCPNGVERLICEWVENQPEPAEEDLEAKCPHCTARLGDFASVSAMRNHISSHTKVQPKRRPDYQTSELSKLDNRNRGNLAHLPRHVCHLVHAPTNLSITR